MDYLDELRTILNEINVGGKELPGDDDGEDFVDDGGDDNAQQQSQTTDTSDDDEGGEDFMDDSGDNSDTDTSDQTTSDDTGTDDDSDGDTGEDFMDDSDGDTSGEGDDNPDDTSDGDDEGGEDFMTDDGDDSGDDGEGDDTSDGGEDGDTSDDNSDEGGDDYDINKIEDELFSSLTPEQIAIKNHELKENFTELYSIIGSTLVRINDIAKTNDNINVLKFITEKLIELRDMIDYNITTAYQTRTYIENNIIYQQCIATLNAISQIIDQIPNLDGKKSDTIEDKEEQDKKGYPVGQDDNGTNSLEISDASTTISTEESYDYSSDYNDLF